jgi:hypothetical protein
MAAPRPGGAGARPCLARAAGTVLVGLMLAATPTRAEEQSPGSEDPRQAVAAGQALLVEQQYRAAIELIKPYAPQLSPTPEARALTLLLAAAYLGDGNAFWAIRTLAARVETQADDCELRVWLAFAHFQLAQLERAREVLGHASCQVPGPQAARVALLSALLAKTEGKEQDAAAELDRAWAAEEMYAEDREALAALTQQIDGQRIPDVSWKLDGRQGFTSNALLGSPTDPNASESIRDTTSGYTQLALWFRLSPAVRLPVRPVLEGELRSFQLDNPELSAQSYLSLTGRLGIFVGSRLPRLLLAWRPEYLRLAGGALATTGANWYASAHRVEAELEVKPWLLAFAGGGRRDFRPLIRDRWELDAGLGGQVAFASRLTLVWAVSGRRHWTDAGTYDLWGGTALANLLYTFAMGVQPRVGVTLAGDSYPHWNGYLGPVGSTENRRDLFLKTTAALWSPVVLGVRFGILYEYSHRNSTAPLFEFSDHRASVMLTWTGSAALTGPKAAPSRPVADIAWGLGRADSRLRERVQDYLREDERTLQRSCGCRE